MPRSELARGRDEFDALVSAIVKGLRAAGLAPSRGLTTAEVAELLRVGQDKVLGWIRAGDLVATNTTSTRCGKPRWVISRESLDVFLKGRSSEPRPKLPHRQRARGQTDYFPD